MILFFWNLLLAAVWAVATGLFTLGNLLVGFAIGYLILLYLSRVLGPSKYFGKVVQVIGFSFFYIKQLIVSNIRVAYDVMTPTHYMRPGVLSVPLSVETDAEITLLANLITLTPGTLALDLSPDRRVLFVHFMYVDDDPQLSVQELKDGLERRVLEVLR